MTLPEEERQQLPLMFKVQDICKVIRVSKTIAYALVAQSTFPKIQCGRVVRMDLSRMLRGSV